MKRIIWAGLAAQRRQGLASAMSVLTLCSIVALDLVLIPPFGARGAAWASLGAYWLGGLAMLAVFWFLNRGTWSTRPSIRADLHLAWTTMRSLTRRTPS